MDAKVQEPGLKEPPAPPSLQEMLPVGAVGEVDESVTVAVSVAELLLTGAEVPEFGDTDVLVGCGGWLTVRDEVPALDECPESPA